MRRRHGLLTARGTARGHEADRSGGPTIMTEGCFKGCQKLMSRESDHVITTSLPLFVLLGNIKLLQLQKENTEKI